MRILFPYIGDTVGGSHISSWQLINRLKELGVDPVILLHLNQGKLAEWLNEKGAAWHYVPLPVLKSTRRIDVNAWKTYTGIKQAQKVLQKHHIDIVHGNDGRINRAWAVWAKRVGIPMVWHQRLRFSKSKHLPFNVSYAKGVISISQFVASGAPKLKIPHEVIYNPIETEPTNRDYCKATLRKELGLSKETAIIGCFGNSQRWKRPDTLVKATHLLKTKHKTYNFQVLWFGDDRDGFLSKLLNATDSSVPIKQIPFRKDVYHAMAGCNIMVAPSQNEPFGRTLVEGMMAGVPVIASDSGGHKEIIQHEQNGLLFPVGNAEALALAIKRLLSNNELTEKMIVGGKETVQLYDPRRHAEKVLAFYQKCMVYKP